MARKPEYRRIAISAIDVPEGRLSAVRAARVETIGKTARAVGQLQAINVIDEGGGRFTLLAGAKRLAALDLAGENEIDARVHPAGSLDDDGRRLVEIVENLDRQDLSALERAEHLAALKAIHERVFPEAKRGGRRGNQHTGGQRRQNEIFSFSQQAAEITGLSRRAIEVAVAIVAGLSDLSKARIGGTWLEDHQAGLKLLAAQDQSVQDAVLDLLFSTPPEAATVADALALTQGRRLLSAAEKMFAATLGNFSRMAAPQREAFFDAHEAAVRAHAKKRGWL